MQPTNRRPEVALPASKKLPSGKALALPGAFVIALVTLGLLLGEPLLARPILGAAGVLLLWTAALYVTARRSGRTLGLEIVLRQPHYVQASVLVVIFSYWGWHLPAIRAFAPLVLAQLLFAYGLHILLTWSRRDTYELGFGPVPITLSMNFFLLFKPEWFYWQFVMVALGFLAKEFIRWQRDGRSVPIMNLMVRVIDRGATSGRLKLLDFSKLGERLTSAQRRVATVGLWTVIFVAISGTGGLGDEHPGQYLPFWREACDEGSARACDYVPHMLGNFCEKDSGWACNELGIHLFQLESDRLGAMAAISRGCDLQFPTACENVNRMTAGPWVLASAPPLVADLPIVLRGSKGAIRERDPGALYALGCKRGWPDMCGEQPVGP